MRSLVSRLAKAAARSLSRCLALLCASPRSSDRSSSSMQAKHSTLASGASALASNVESKLCGADGSLVSRHRLAGPIGLAALHTFQLTATQHAQGAPGVFVGSDAGRIVLSAPQQPPVLPQRAVKRRRVEPTKEEVDRTLCYARRLAQLNGELDSVPVDHRALMVKTLERLYELQAHDGERAVESLSTDVKSMPTASLTSGLSARKALVLTARLTPGAVVSLQRLMFCLPSPPDGQLCCCNGSVLDQKALPVGEHARVALEMGLTTLQVVCSVGVPFVPVCSPKPEGAPVQEGPEKGAKRVRAA